MKAMARYLENLERTVNRLETRKVMLMRKNKEVVLFSLQRTTSGA